MTGVERVEILPSRSLVGCGCPRIVLPDQRIKLWHRCLSAEPAEERDAPAAPVRAAVPRPVQPSGGGYAPGGVDHSRPWAPPPRRRPAALPTTGYIVAGRPSGIGLQHLFSRPGEWSLCGEAVWLEVQRAELISPLTWICVRCRELAEVAEREVPLFVEWIRDRRCPRCRGPLTDPGRSPGGWRHCPACRCGWGTKAHPDGSLSPIRRDWPVPVQAEVAAHA